MGSQWYYMLSGHEVGPVGFDVLADLVRDGRLSGSDLVRREWPSDWQRADSVVGLFRAARLAPPTAAVGEETPDVGVVPGSAAGGTSRVGEWTAWFPAVRRLGNPGPADSVVRSSRGPSARRRPTTGNSGFAAEPRARPPAETSTEGSPPDSTETEAESVGGDGWSETVAAALATADARRAAGRPRPLRRRSLGVEASTFRLLRVLLRPIGAIVSMSARIVIGRGRRSEWVAEYLAAVEGRLPSPAVLRTGFRFGAALVAANAVACAILGWSERQAMRFPSRDGSAGSAFPVLGECGPTEYLLLLAHSVVLSAAAAYAFAAWLESRAEE